MPLPLCLPPGWGSAGWGWAPFGGGGPLSSDLPQHPPFDVYCVGPCAEMEDIAQYHEVVLVGGITDPLTGDLVLASGGQGSVPTAQSLEITKPTPSIWTLELTGKFTNLPPTLSSLTGGIGQVFAGVWNDQGGSAGLFFSQQGIGYAAYQNDPVIPIPNSENIINETDYWTVRMVGNVNTGALFVYITLSSLLDEGIGHQLRFVVALPTQEGAHQEHTLVSCTGTGSALCRIDIRSICLAGSSIVPNMPPVADAGNDQEVKLCTIGQLDGSASFDPEGAPVTYFWRLVDAPTASQWVFEGFDGWTAPDPSGFTNEYHTFNPLTPLNLTAGDVLTTPDGSYVIHAIDTTDPSDQVITIDGYYLVAGQQYAHYFKLVKQGALYRPATVNPTFYPDAAGFWKFDLVVSDGQLYSEPAIVIESVRESPVPRGCTPDLSFIWNYLSDFWSLVQDKEPIETVWSAIAQIASAELLKLWQVDYNKSLRDIQRTMVRKWLYYDLLIQEPFFDMTTCPCMNVPNGFLYGSSGQVLPAAPIVPGTGLNPCGYRTNIALAGLDIQQNDLLLLNGVGYRIDSVVPDTGSSTYGDLVLLDPIYQVPPPGPLPVISNWAIVRSITSSQIDFWGGLVTYNDDVIVEVLDRTTGQYEFYKSKAIGVCEAVPQSLAADPTQWAQWALDTTGRYALYFVGVFRRSHIAVSDRIRDIPFLQDTIKDAPIDEVLQRNIDFFIEQYRGRTCIRFADVWQHQELDSTQTPPALVWVADPTPPSRLWGEYNYIENLSVVESNFGAVAGLTVADLSAVQAQVPGEVDYLEAVKGLWFVYFSAQTPWALRIGAQILLGLPYAEEDGTIVQIIPNLSVAATRVLVADNGDNGIVRSYDYADGLSLETNPVTGLPYAVGDAITQFSPLCTGVTVQDWVNTPGWIAPYVTQGVLYEVQKYFLFPVVIAEPAYTLAGALLTRQLMLNVKAAHTWPIIVDHVVLTPTDIDVEEDFSMRVKLSIYEGPCTGYPQQHPLMWNVGDTGPVTVFPKPATTTDSTVVGQHRHDYYPGSGWYSSWKSAYGVKDYPDQGYADFYDPSIVAPSFPLLLHVIPRAGAATTDTVITDAWASCLSGFYVEIVPNTVEAAPNYTLTVWVNGTAYSSYDFTVALAPGETVFRAVVSYPFTSYDIPAGAAVTMRLTVGVGGSGTPDWQYCRAIANLGYHYQGQMLWGYIAASTGSHPYPNPPYPGGDTLCPELPLAVTVYSAWPVAQMPQFGSIFVYGDPVYPAYVDTSGAEPAIVVDWSSPTHSVSPGTGDPGWSFTQNLDPPSSPYTGYVSKRYY